MSDHESTHFKDSANHALETLLQNSYISTKDYLLYSNVLVGPPKIIDIKPLEIKEKSIVTTGLDIQDYEPHHIIFKSKHQHHTAHIINSIIAPEMSILYIDKDARKWPYTKGCKIVCTKKYHY